MYTFRLGTSSIYKNFRGKKLNITVKIKSRAKRDCKETYLNGVKLKDNFIAEARFKR